MHPFPPHRELLPPASVSPRCHELWRHEGIASNNDSTEPPPGQTYFPRDRSPSGTTPPDSSPRAWYLLVEGSVLLLEHAHTGLISHQQPHISQHPPPLLCRRPSCVSVSACSGGDRPREEEHRERNEKRPEERAEECSEMWTRW
ncbi:unnamed protein product [Gadus morhua 'NCC']